MDTYNRSGQWDGLYVTAAYEKEICAAMEIIGTDISGIKSVETDGQLPDGRFYGDLTNVYGFTMLVKHSGIDVSGKKAVVFGTGGASSAVAAALRDLRAGEIIAVSSGMVPEQHRDADVIVNATSAGMYPDNGASPVDLSLFPSLSGVFDLICDPLRTALLLQAEELNIPCRNGLFMLAAKAARSAELFTGKMLGDDRIGRIHDKLYKKMQSIALIGMPGVGKTTAARKISRLTGRAFYDTDEEIEKRYGITPAQLIRTEGEDAFRRIETAVLADVSRHPHAVIATGGGTVTREENYPLLRQNSRIVWLKRDISELSTEDRPISQAGRLEELYRVRKPMYEAFADEETDLGPLETIIGLERYVEPDE